MYLLTTVLAFTPARACPGRSGDAATAEPECTTVDDGSHTVALGRPERALVVVDPARSARQPDLVGPESCSWTTSMMAQRVLEKGTPWTYVGRLAASIDALPSRVASPFTLGPDRRIHVVANEILEQLERASGAPLSPDARVELTGRVLEVDGITYFVATALVPVAS